MIKHLTVLIAFLMTLSSTVGAASSEETLPTHAYWPRARQRIAANMVALACGYRGLFACWCHSGALRTLRRRGVGLG